MGSTGGDPAGKDLPFQELDIPGGGELICVGAAVAASKPVIPEKPSMWSKERFSSMRTKTCLIDAMLEKCLNSGELKGLTGPYLRVRPAPSSKADYPEAWGRTFPLAAAPFRFAALFTGLTRLMRCVRIC